MQNCNHCVLRYFVWSRVIIKESYHLEEHDCSQCIGIPVFPVICYVISEAHVWHNVITRLEYWQWYIVHLFIPRCTNMIEAFWGIYQMTYTCSRGSIGEGSFQTWMVMHLSKWILVGPMWNPHNSDRGPSGAPNNSNSFWYHSDIKNGRNIDHLEGILRVRGFWQTKTSRSEFLASTWGDSYWQVHYHSDIFSWTFH